MTQNGVPLPVGYSRISLEQTDSTNSEALRRAREGADGKLWITATSQSAGRGRTGRDWESRTGNLFASLSLRPQCRLETAVQLAFVAGVALFESVAALGRAVPEHLALKWPNDLLLDNAKLGGILLESTHTPGSTTPAIIIGTGLNLVSHPERPAMPATDLVAHGHDVSAEHAFASLARHTAQWLDAWAEGQGWSTVRSAWEERSVATGTRIRVKPGDRDIEGLYAGIDRQGALLVNDAKGREIKVNAGDVFLL